MYTYVYVCGTACRFLCASKWGNKCAVVFKLN